MANTINLTITDATKGKITGTYVKNYYFDDAVFTDNSVNYTKTNNNDHTFAIECNDGYIWNNDNITKIKVFANNLLSVWIRYIGSYFLTDANISLNDDKTKLLINFNNDCTDSTKFAKSFDGSTMDMSATYHDDFTDDLFISTKPAYTVSITGTLTNCTCNYTDGETVDLNKSIVITANDGYVFDADTSYRYKRGATTQTFKKSDDLKTLSVSTMYDGYNYDLNKDYTANEIPQTVTYTITENLTGVTSDNTDTTIDENTEKTIVYTANEHYKFTDYTATLGTFTLSEDKTKLTLVFTANSDNTITVTAVEKAKYTITENLTDCTSDNKLTEVYEGDSINIAYAPNSGYDMDSAKSSFNTGSIKIDSKYSLIWENTNVQENIINNVVASKRVSYYSITENLTNVTSDNKQTEVAENTEKTIVYTANDGYLIDTYVATLGTFTKSKDNKTVTLVYDATTDNVITVTGKKKGTVSITGTFTNCTCNYTDGETVDSAKRLEITANNGYEFTSNFKYRIGSLTNTFTKTNDNKTLYISSMDESNNYRIINDITATKAIEKLSTFTNLYQITNDDLTKLSKLRFNETTTGETVDNGAFIADLYILPFDLPSDLLGDYTAIQLGKYTTTANLGTLLNNYLLTIDLGKITIPEKYKNAYDYLNTTCILKVPYADDIELNSEYVIGQTISITYTVDLYSGNTTINVKSSFTNGTVYSEVITPFIKIPFVQKQTQVIINELSDFNTNVIDNAYVEIIRNIPYYSDDLNNEYGKETIDYNIISSVSGYCEITNVELLSDCTNDEKEQIKTLLEQGVYINE